MFKKTLVALAALGAFAGSAAAADVTLYGVADAGLLYNHSETQGYKGAATETDSLGMASGMNATSRFGLKGTEDLGNGLKVSFKLENGYNLDDGTLGNGGRLFGREASVTLAGAFGQVSFGRMGGVASSAGTYDLVYGIADAFDGGDNDILGLTISDRYDNMVTYQTPEFAGLQATVQYSFKQDSTADNTLEGSSKASRYASAALTGKYGPAQFVAAYELMKQPNTTTNDDTNIFYLGGNYDAGVAKFFALAQYAKGARSFGSTSFSDVTGGLLSAVNKHAEDNQAAWRVGFDNAQDDGVDSYGLHLGAIVPVAGGDLTVAAYYVDGDTSTMGVWNDTNAGDKNVYKRGDVSADLSYVGITARYAYPLSKRTSLYAGAGYAQAKSEISAKDAGTMQALHDTFQNDAKDEIVQAYVGLTHTF